MSRTKKRLMELVAGSSKTEKPVIICFHGEEIPKDNINGRPVIVFKDFPKEAALKMKAGIKGSETK